MHYTVVYSLGLVGLWCIAHLEGHDSCNSLSQTLLRLLLLSCCRVLMRLLLCTRTCPYAPLLLLYTLCRAICSLSNIFLAQRAQLQLILAFLCRWQYCYVVAACIITVSWGMVFVAVVLSLYLLLLLLLLSSPRLARVSEPAEHVDEFSISIGLAVHV